MISPTQVPQRKTNLPRKTEMRLGSTTKFFEEIIASIFRDKTYFYKFKNFYLFIGLWLENEIVGMSRCVMTMLSKIGQIKVVTHSFVRLFAILPLFYLLFIYLFFWFNCVSSYQTCSLFNDSVLYEIGRDNSHRGLSPHIALQWVANNK